MRVTVVICTWNRCELLRSTLESLRALEVPADHAWELVVINNNSSDATGAVIDRFRGLLPLRGVFEPEVGLSKARNTAVRASTGQLLLFTDDDVAVDSKWMSAYLDAAQSWPAAQYFGGLVRPWFAAAVPRWVRRNQSALAGMLCALDIGPVSREFSRGEFPYGLNMAMRREVFTLASFDERVGRKGDAQLRDSETSLFLALERLGVRGVWVPGAVIAHYIPANRANLRYLWSYHHGSGRSAVRLDEVCGLRLPSRLWRGGLNGLIEASRRPTDWPRHLAGVARLSGRLYESWRLARARNGMAAEVPPKCQ